MTGRSLKARLLRNVRLLDRWRDPVIVPLGARPVLEAVAEMAAASGPSLEYRIDPEIEGHRSLAGWVAWRMDALGAETEIAGHLGLLMDAELVLLTPEGGLTLNLPLRTTPPRAAHGAASRDEVAKPAPAVRGFVDRGGRPRKGEDRRQRSLRLMQSMPTGPRDGETSGKPHAETSDETRFPGEVSAAENPGFPKPVSRGFLAAAKESDQSNLFGQQQPKEEQTGTCGETGVSEVSGGEVSGAVSAGPVPATAAALVFALSGILELEGDTKEDRLGLVTRWLALPGMTAERIVAIARDRKGRHQAKVDRGQGAPIRNLSFIDLAVQDAGGVRIAPTRPAPAQVPATAGPSLPLRLKRPWMTGVTENLLAIAIERSDPGNPAQLAETTARLQRQDPKLLALLYEARPDLRDVGTMREAG